MPKMANKKEDKILVTSLFINDVNTWSRLNFLLCQNCNLVHTTSNIESQARLNKVHDGDGEAGGGEGGEGGERRQ